MRSDDSRCLDIRVREPLGSLETKNLKRVARWREKASSIYDNIVHRENKEQKPPRSSNPALSSGTPRRPVKVLNTAPSIRIVASLDWLYPVQPSVHFPAPDRTSQWTGVLATSLVHWQVRRPGSFVRAVDSTVRRVQFGGGPDRAVSFAHLGRDRSWHFTPCFSDLPGIRRSTGIPPRLGNIVSATRVREAEPFCITRVSRDPALSNAERVGPQGVPFEVRKVSARRGGLPGPVEPVLRERMPVMSRRLDLLQRKGAYGPGRRPSGREQNLAAKTSCPRPTSRSAAAKRTCQSKEAPRLCAQLCLDPVESTRIGANLSRLSGLTSQNSQVPAGALGGT